MLFLDIARDAEYGRLLTFAKNARDHMQQAGVLATLCKAASKAKTLLLADCWQWANRNVHQTSPELLMMLCLLVLIIALLLSMSAVMQVWKALIHGILQRTSQ